MFHLQLRCGIAPHRGVSEDSGADRRILVPILTIQPAARLYLSFDDEPVCVSHAHLRKLFPGTEAAAADSRRLRLLPVPCARGTTRAFAREARARRRRA